MTNNIVIDFNNLAENLETNNMNLCFIGNGFLFIEDLQKNLYEIDIYRQGSYLDQLIKDGDRIEFTLVDSSISANVKEYRKDIWNASDVREFIEIHCN